MSALFARIPRRLLLAAFWIAVVVVGVLALVPITTHMPTTGWDKSNHALAFVVLGVLGAACWPTAALRAWVALAAYGGAIEIAQTFTETRSGDWHDWLADVVGLVVAALVWRSRMPARDSGGRGG
jgi:VanZ family protein